jgi:hypothetical protein
MYKYLDSLSSEKKLFTFLASPVLHIFLAEWLIFTKNWLPARVRREMNKTDLDLKIQGSFRHVVPNSNQVQD